MYFPNLIGITGEFGSGKSLYALELALSIANSYQKSIVSNFPIDAKYIRIYCRKNNLNWFAANGRIIYLDLSKYDIEYLISRPHTVVLLDEAGVFLNSRFWASHSKEFLARLFQLRHFDIHLISCFHFLEQVDKQFRSVIQHWIICRASCRYSRSLKAPQILIRFILHYSPGKFHRLQEDTQAKQAIIRPFLWAKYKKISVPFLNYIFNEFSNLLLVFSCLFKHQSLDKIRLYPHSEALLFKAYNSLDRDLGIKSFNRGRKYMISRKNQLICFYEFLIIVRFINKYLYNLLEPLDKPVQDMYNFDVA